MNDLFFDEDNGTVLTYDELLAQVEKEWSYDKWLDTYAEYELIQIITDIILGETDAEELRDLYKDFIESKALDDYPVVELSEGTIALIKREK